MYSVPDFFVALALAKACSVDSAALIKIIPIFPDENILVRSFRIVKLC
jgi:hypothetical protein